jgi:hypothetical protein
MGTQITPTRDSRHVTLDIETTLWLREEAHRCGWAGIGRVIDRLVMDEKRRRKPDAK